MRRIGLLSVVSVGLAMSVHLALGQSPALSDLESVTGSQAGCPMQIVDASFERPGRIMLISDGLASAEPTLRLHYWNFSGKEIESVVLTAWIKVKNSPYQLDSTVYPFQLKLAPEAPLGDDAQATQALKLKSNAFGLDRIELSQVIYSDGTMWKPERKNCVYHYMGTTARAAR
jgi:hypothetical protein